jgi:hypothetical protein
VWALPGGAPVAVALADDEELCMTTIRFSTKEFRSIPSPTGGSRIGVFFSPAGSVSRDLWDWRDVNPREVNTRTNTYDEIVSTLTQDSSRFHERNRGLTIVADEIAYDEKRHEAIVQLVDKKVHGVVDGAHTLNAILGAQETPPADAWPAYVFVKIVTGIDADQIAEIAGGLNTSQQVNLTSLENLRKHFAPLKTVLAGQPYAEKIGYKMNGEEPIDVREVLYYLAVFDCVAYDDKKHPVALFGRKEGIVRKFAEQADKPKSGDSFPILTAMAPEVLRLRDVIEREALKLPGVGRYRQGKGSRVRSAKYIGNQLHFLDEVVDGKIPLGWLLPILAAFRANVKWDKPKGSFSWIVPIDDLVAASIEKLVLGIMEVHERENSRPEYVGRNSLAWRMSYGTVANAILEWQLKTERKGR